MPSIRPKTPSRWRFDCRQGGGRGTGEEERGSLEAHVRKHKAPRPLSDRSRTIPLSAEGRPGREIVFRTGGTSARSASGASGSPRSESRAARTGAAPAVAALDLATGVVIGRRFGRHRATEFLGFLLDVEAAVPEGLVVHLVIDSCATRETEKVRNWLARRRHWHVHFTPTSASWLNHVECWSAELARKKLQRGVHRSVAELNADIMSFIDAHDEKQRPYRWVKSADETPASVRRFCLMMNRPEASEEDSCDLEFRETSGPAQAVPESPSVRNLADRW